MKIYYKENFNEKMNKKMKDLMIIDIKKIKNEKIDDINDKSISKSIISEKKKNCEKREYRE